MRLKSITAFCLRFNRITRSTTKEIAADDLPSSTGESEEESKQTKTCISLDINHKDMSDILSAIENIHDVLVNGNSLIVSVLICTHFFVSISKFEFEP